MKVRTGDWSVEFPGPDSQIVTAADQAAPGKGRRRPVVVRGRAGMANPDNFVTGMRTCRSRRHHRRRIRPLARPPPAKLTQPSRGTQFSAEQNASKYNRRPQHAAAYLVSVNKADAPGANRAKPLDRTIQTIYPG